MKKFFNEFKNFIKKGNVIDLAVGVIIGAAFGKIVTSLVNDLLTPLIVLALGKSSLKDLALVIKKPVLESGEVVQPAVMLYWGNFLQTILDFIIIALVIFIIVRMVIKAQSTGKKISNKTKKVIKKIEAPFENLINKSKAEKVNCLDDSDEEEPINLDNDNEDQSQVLSNEQPPTVEGLLTEIRNLLKEQQK